MYSVVYYILKHIQPLKLMDHVMIYGILLYGLLFQALLKYKYSIIMLIITPFIFLDIGLYIYINTLSPAKSKDEIKNIYDDITFKTLINSEREPSIIE